MHMLKSNFIILIITFIILQVSYVVAEEKFLSLKKNKVNVRYGPSFDSPVKYIYKKINLSNIYQPFCNGHYSFYTLFNNHLFIIRSNREIGSSITQKFLKTHYFVTNAHFYGFLFFLRKKNLTC